MGEVRERAIEGVSYLGFWVRGKSLIRNGLFFSPLLAFSLSKIHRGNVGRVYLACMHLSKAVVRLIRESRGVLAEGSFFSFRIITPWINVTVSNCRESYGGMWAASEVHDIQLYLLSYVV